MTRDMLSLLASMSLVLAFGAVVNLLDGDVLLGLLSLLASVLGFGVVRAALVSEQRARRRQARGER